ncbi:MAG: thiamine-phosphate kinase [Gammaproteobacteria bacterium]|nr:thiamine-phosphate kinase [Gammaproteobacteria bacterium]MBQ0841111.1 thiamine-phosphate kinase [Gammaproteobacteria bacterium]
MAADEFSLIKRYFSNCGAAGSATLLGVGDDCALLAPPVGEVLAVTTDTLLAGVHFPDNSPARLIAQRALAVNLSDMAAMGATPRWFQLALTMPDADQDWLAGFSAGLDAMARQFNCALVGGDTTRGPLTISITLMGTVPAAQALKRSGAKPGDRIYVTGSLGDGAAGLAALEGKLSASVEDCAYFNDRFWQPQARVAQGLELREFASAAIDISDGLLADLGHITEASEVGALLEVDKLPLSQALHRAAGSKLGLSWALTGGDDYELCFTVPANGLAQCQRLIDTGLLSATPIGQIIDGQGVRCVDEDGQSVAVECSGYKHF